MTFNIDELEALIEKARRSDPFYDPIRPHTRRVKTVEIPERPSPLYQIVTGLPRVHDSMDGFSFKVLLHKGWKEFLAPLGPPRQATIDAWLESPGKNLLEGYRFGTDRLYGPGRIKLAFGPWGLEHATIPGSSCGFDISEDITNCPTDGRVLMTHNVDSINQASLLQAIFHWWANHWILERWSIDNASFKDYSQNKSL